MSIFGKMNEGLPLGHPAMEDVRADGACLEQSEARCLARRDSPSAPMAGWPSAPIITPAVKPITSSTRSAESNEAASAPPPSQKIG